MLILFVVYDDVPDKQILIIIVIFCDFCLLPVLLVISKIFSHEYKASFLQKRYGMSVTLCFFSDLGNGQNYHFSDTLYP